MIEKKRKGLLKSNNTMIKIRIRENKSNDNDAGQFHEQLIEDFKTESFNGRSPTGAMYMISTYPIDVNEERNSGWVYLYIDLMRDV